MSLWSWLWRHHLYWIFFSSLSKIIQTFKDHFSYRTVTLKKFFLLSIIILLGLWNRIKLIIFIIYLYKYTDSVKKKNIYIFDKLIGTIKLIPYNPPTIRCILPQNLKPSQIRRTIIVQFNSHWIIKPCKLNSLCYFNKLFIKFNKMKKWTVKLLKTISMSKLKSSVNIH